MSAALELLQQEIADENCRTLIECRAHPVECGLGKPVYDTQMLEPWQINDEDMLATRRHDIARAVQYLEMRGLIERPVADRPELVCFKENV